MGERWLCKPEVVGSIPISSTKVARAARELGSSSAAGPKRGPDEPRASGSSGWPDPKIQETSTDVSLVSDN